MQKAPRSIDAVRGSFDYKAREPRALRGAGFSVACWRIGQAHTQVSLNIGRRIGFISPIEKNHAQIRAFSVNANTPWGLPNYFKKSITV